MAQSVGFLQLMEGVGVPVVAQMEAGAGARAPRRVRPTADRRGTIPQRLNYLFETVHAPGSKPYSAAAVAEWINNNEGEISSVYILKILDGSRVEPKQKYLKPLAQYFCVPLTFFYDEDPPELDGVALNAEILMRDEKVRSAATRMARLSRRSQDSVSDLIDALLVAEGKGEKDA